MLCLLARPDARRVMQSTRSANCRLEASHASQGTGTLIHSNGVTHVLAGQGDVMRNPAKDENVDKVHQIASSTVSSLWPPEDWQRVSAMPFVSLFTAS